MDAGLSNEHDSGVERPVDAGMIAKLDAGLLRSSDGGPLDGDQETDAGFSDIATQDGSDAGQNSGEEEEDGCSCTQTVYPSPWALTFLTVLLLLRRRRYYR